ncbi:hypothetical protein [Neorhizobium sp. DT-125]|uniref:hypothetical protein n=1 Tax=Neorhizobium sp. DT-125 TaxID=3396163 RepID=UPI003F1D802B
MKPPIEADESRGEGGFALLAVLGFMLLFAMFLMPFAASSRVKALTSSYEYDQTRLGYAAEAIDGYVAWRLGHDSHWKLRAEEGEFLSLHCMIGDAVITISIVPHARLINLNTAEEPLLRAGFEEIGLTGQEAENIANKVMRFRSLRMIDDGEAAGVNAGLKHAPFEDISELHDFDALRGFSLTKLGRTFSVHSGRAILQKPNESSGPSQNYTIETVLFDGDSWGGDAAIFLTGNRMSPSRRIASIELDVKPERPKQARGCEAVLDQDVIRLMAEVLT